MRDAYLNTRQYGINLLFIGPSRFELFLMIHFPSEWIVLSFMNTITLQRLCSASALGVNPCQFRLNFGTALPM